MSWNNKRGWSRQQDAEAILRSLSDLYLNPNKPNGLRFPKLAPRTLPNGVSNGDYQQNVSGDKALTGSENWNLDPLTQTNTLTFSTPIADIKQGTDLAIASNLFPTVPNIVWPTADYESIANNTGIFVWVKVLKTRLSTPDLVGFKAWLAQQLANGNPLTIRYQLATPIDTLNSPVRNPIQDQAGKVGKNLFDAISVTKGYYVNIADGTLGGGGVDSADTSDYIPVISGNQYVKSGGVSSFEGFALYDVNKVFVSGGFSNSFIPSVDGYVRVTVKRVDLSVFQLELGSTATAYEPYGKANALMTNVGWTSADGYRVETINGKTNVFFNLDGSDTFGALNSASAPNPTGSDDFWQLVVFRTSDLSAIQYWGLSRNLSDAATAQYGFVMLQSNTEYRINGVVVSLPAPTNELQYVLYGRINGVRFFQKNSTEQHNATFTDSIVTRPNTQLGARSNSADGLSKLLFAKGLQGICAMGVGPQGSIDKAKLVATVNKAMKQIYGLGA